MRQYIKNIGMLLTFATAVQLSANAQTSNSSYFLEGAQFRHQLNPALGVQRNYISMPALGNLTIGARSSAGVSNFLYTLPNGDLTTFMNGVVDRNEFLGSLPNKVRIGADLDMTILAFGFHAWNGFNTFSLGLKSRTNFNMPKDLFAFMKDPAEERYEIENFGMNTTNYVELALGHSHKINDQWTVGAKAKFLLGAARAKVKIEKLNVELAENAWKITPQNATFETAVGGMMLPTKGETGNYQEDDYMLDADGNRTDVLKPGTDEQVSYDDIDFDSGSVGPAGWGLAFDLGATYKLNDDWQFSAAVLDLGFMSWKDAIKGSMSNTFEFDGFHEVPVEETEENKHNSLENQTDRMVDDLADLAKFKRDEVGGKMTSALAATVNLGAQYTLPVYRKVNFGFLSSTKIYGENSWTEARLSANYAPASFFEMSLNYALSNFGSTAGMFLNFCHPSLDLFLGVDFPIGKMEPSYFVPINKFGLQVNLGMNITFGKLRKESKLSKKLVKNTSSDEII